jgi:hypothetical protein
MPHRHAIFRQPTPEEAELLLRRAELSTLRATLATHEGALAALRNQLHSFEARYIRQVGVLYVQLDEWQTRIAELEVAAESMHETERFLREANLREALKSGPDEPEASTLEPVTLDLRTLFREVAKRLHPDFAADAHDERRRTHLMAQANDALFRKDADLLHRMLNGYDPSSGLGEPIAIALARTLEQIVKVEADLLAVEATLDELKHSEMADLQRRTAVAAQRGSDLLAEMAARVKGSIGIAMRRYELDLGRLRRKEAALIQNRFCRLKSISPETPSPDTTHSPFPDTMDE